MIFDTPKWLVLPRWLLRHWGGALALSGALLALGALRGSLIDPGVPQEVFAALLYTGAAIFGIVALAAIVSWLADLFLADQSYEVRAIRRSEIEDLLPLYDQLIGGERPSLNDIKSVVNANKTILRILERHSRRTYRTNVTTVGFCTIFPITKDAADQLEAGRLTGIQMHPTHVCTPRQRPYAIYIGSIAARGTEARGRILSYVLGAIDDEGANGARAVYTRPVTKDGLRLAQQYDFAAVDPRTSSKELKHIYKLELPRASLGTGSARGRRVGRATSR